MTSIQHRVVTQTQSTTNHLDDHLDALLDDLQTTVSRPGTSLALTPHKSPMMNGSSFGGHINLPPGASGYREITTTVTRDANGVPMTSREYQIEYLNPANSVTILDDRSTSPSMDLLKSEDLAGHKIQSYKTEVYDYKYSKTTSDKKMTRSPELDVGSQRAIENGKTHLTESKFEKHFREKPQVHEGVSYSTIEESDKVRSDAKSGRNMNELDLLLKELNTSSSDSRTMPRREQHVHTVETKMETNSERYPEFSATMPKRSGATMKETTHVENRMNRAQSPSLSYESSRSPGRTVTVRREYNKMESSNHTSRRDSPSTRNRSAEMSPTLRRRTPSPSSGEFRPSNFSNYPLSPKELTPTRTVTSKSYSYSSTGKRTPTPTATFDEPQPYRSPSPVSFPQKRSPSPNRRSLNRSDSGRNYSPQVSPEHPAMSSYKYASHSREQSRYSTGGGYENQSESVSRPFPTSTPIPQRDQNPPKKLDDLMASLDDGINTPQGREYNRGGGEYTHKIEIARESRETHDGGLQRSPSFERNVRPSNVKVSQTYSQQQNQEYHNQGQQREQHPGSYHKEYQRREEYHTSSQQHYPGQFQQPPQQYPRSPQQKEQYHQQQQHQNLMQQQQQHQKQQHYQQSQGYQRENYQQNQSHQYQQSQQYQYQQHHEYQQQQQQQHQQQQQRGQSPRPMNESMASQEYRVGSRSVAGPPVYYPPGVELFTKKEEAMLNQEQNQKKGKLKSKSDKGKDKGKKVTGVPMCLPVCCAMPCSIM